jgi:hypothetical protein
MASPPCCWTADCAASRPVVTAVDQVIDDAMRAFGALLTAGDSGRSQPFWPRARLKELHVDLPPSFAWLEG